MRITGGLHRGRVLGVPRSDKVRPTQDMVREALFSMLREDVKGARFLDLYAGTGAVGLEAISRGASDVFWVEEDRLVAKSARANIAAIAGEGFLRNLAVADAAQWIKRYRSEPFDIVYADPPYLKAMEDGLASLARGLAASMVVRAGALLACETSSSAPALEIPDWTMLRDRVYGKTRLTIRQFLPARGKED